MHADVVMATEDAIVLRDINPQAPVHLLVIPRSHHRDATALAQDDPALLGRLMELAVQQAQAHDLADPGYRLVVNTGVDGGQTVSHIHIHLLGGRRLGWPPG